MAFRFTLQSMFRLWENRERYERLRLETLSAKLFRIRREIAATQESSLNERGALTHQLAEGLTASQLHFALLCEAGRRRYLELLEKQAAELEQLRKAQQILFENARRQRETFENLRTRQWEAYRLEADRRLQRQIDELFLLRLRFESDE